jgi:predicted MFS family arabinose efflux permease
VIGSFGGVWRASAASVLAATADNFLLFLMFWVAGPQGWSGLETALVILALRLPTLVGGVVGGRAVDRFGGRPLMLVDASARGLLMVALAIAGWSGQLPLAAVLITGALAGGLAPVTYAGARWLVPRLVPDDDVPRANAALSLSDQLPMLAGAALVAPALELLGPGRAMLVAAGMLAVAGGLAFGLPRRASFAGDPHAAYDAAQTRAGRVSSPWRSPRVVALVGLSIAYYFVYGPFEVVTPAFVREHLHGGESLYGVLWVLFGIGSLATLPLAPRLARRRPGMVNALGTVTWGLVMLPLAFTDSPGVVAAIFLVGGAVWGPYTTIETTALHRWTPPSQHGRVFGTQRALLYTAGPLGAAVGALGLPYLPSATILGASAAACAAAGLLALCLPDLRRAGTAARDALAYRSVPSGPRLDGERVLAWIGALALPRRGGRQCVDELADPVQHRSERDRRDRRAQRVDGDRRAVELEQRPSAVGDVVGGEPQVTQQRE